MTAFMLCKIETCLFEKNKETNSLIFALKKRHALNLSILQIFYSGRFDEYHYFLEILISRFSEPPDYGWPLVIGRWRHFSKRRMLIVREEDYKEFSLSSK